MIDRVLAFGDAWFPNYAPVLDRADGLRAPVERPIDLMIMGAPADPKAIERVHDSRARRIVHWIPSGGLSKVEAAFERWEAAIAEFTGDE